MVSKYQSYLLTIFTAITFYSYAQNIKTHYVNKEGKRTSKAFAKFKREIIKKDDKFFVKDFYLNGTLQMEGCYKDKSLKQRMDTFTYYHLNGKPSATFHYKKGEKHGIAKWYSIDGKLSKSFNYTNGEPSDEDQLNHSEQTTGIGLQKTEVTAIQKADRPLRYRGGQKAIDAYFKTLDYPFEAYRDELYGQIHTVIEIDETGNVGDVDIVIHGSEKIDSTIISNIKKMSDWIPALKNGKAVASRFSFSIKLNYGNHRASTSDAILAKGFFRSGVTDYKNGKFEKATFKFNKAVMLSQMEAKYHYYLGHGYYKMEEKEFACEHWGIANTLDGQILKKEIKKLCGIK